MGLEISYSYKFTITSPINSSYIIREELGFKQGFL